MNDSKKYHTNTNKINILLLSFLSSVFLLFSSSLQEYYYSFLTEKRARGERGGDEGGSDGREGGAGRAVRGGEGGDGGRRGQGERMEAAAQKGADGGKRRGGWARCVGADGEAGRRVAARAGGG